MNRISSAPLSANAWTQAEQPEADAAVDDPEASPASAEGHDSVEPATAFQGPAEDAGFSYQGEEAPSLLRSIEHFYGKAPGSLRYDTPEDLQGVQMVPVFKITGGGGIHEKITEQAAKDAGLPFSLELRKGSAWPDLPCKDPDQVALCPVGTLKDLHREGTLANRSHYGDRQFWHSMTPTSDQPLSNGDVVDKIIQQAKEWYSQGVEGHNDFPIGKMLHMVQDSYSASHTIRDKAGHLEQFQGYDAQDSHAHGDADKLGKGMHSFLDIPGARGALKASTKLLELYARKAPFSEVETYLRHEVYSMAPARANEPAGGSAEPYVKKPTKPSPAYHFI